VNYLEQEEIEKLTAVEKAFLNINTPKDMQKAISLTKFRYYSQSHKKGMQNKADF
jgi:GTP:adenosylcobinamide-phosphate guanylyltransferase